MRIFGDPLARKLGGAGFGSGANAAVPLGACPDALFSDGFESGDISAWSTSVNPGGQLTVGAAGALVGGNGLSVAIAGSVHAYVQDNTPANETTYRVRFYLDPNTLTMTNGNEFVIIQARTGAAASVWFIKLQKVVGGYQLFIFVRDDAFVGQSFTPALTDTSHYLEVYWKAATAPGANDGIFQAYLDGVITFANLSNLDTDTLSVSDILMGAVLELDAGTSGTIYFDAFCSNTTGDEIGP